MGTAPLSTRSGRKASQHPRELQRFIELLRSRGVRSYLEIGARHGDTFYEVVRQCGVRGVAVDLPGGPWGTPHTQSYLFEAARAVDGTVILGDSRSPEIIARVHEHGPFDAVLIDADHRYEAVREDFSLYRSPITALHDIAGEGLVLGDKEMGVPRFWREIRDEYEHIEIIDPSDERPMGIGVVFCA